LSALNTKAVKSEGYFVLDGNKIFVTNAPVADILIIYARHPGGLKMLDISGFILEKTDGNYKVGQVFEKMGLRTSPISEVVLDNCKVPACRVLGRERLGMTIFNESMLWERILMGAYHVGAMEQQYAEVLKYANSRKQFGKKIIEFEAVYDKLIDMKIRIENAKLLLYRTCWDFDNGKRDAADVSMLKLYTSESKVKNSLNAVQTFGAYGYMKETFVEKQLRDSIAAKIYSGTSEIQKMIIAKSLEEGNG
jgi:alkylation response protein AidB-like acyl-CoA dehydrogenase